MQDYTICWIKNFSPSFLHSGGERIFPRVSNKRKTPLHKPKTCFDHKSLNAFMNASQLLPAINEKKNLSSNEMRRLVLTNCQYLGLKRLPQIITPLEITEINCKPAFFLPDFPLSWSHYKFVIASFDFLHLVYGGLLFATSIYHTHITHTFIIKEIFNLTV